MENLAILNFYGQSLTDDAIIALANALSAGGLPSLTDLQFWSQKAGAAGIMALVEQLRAGVAGKLKFIDMSGVCTQPVARRTSAAGGSELRLAGKAPLEAMRKVRVPNLAPLIINRFHTSPP